MKLQNLAPDVRRDATLERIESRAFSPSETATEMRRAADQEITQAKSDIEGLRTELARSNDPALKAELATLDSELDTTWDDLIAETDKAVAKDAPPESGVFEKQKSPEETAQDLLAGTMAGRMNTAALTKLLASEEGRMATEELLDDTIWEILDQTTTDFKRIGALAEVAVNDTALSERLKSRLADRVGKIFAERIVTDPSYLATLEQMQNTLSNTIAGPDSPKLCTETPIDKLIALREIFGERAEHMSRAIDLRNYGRGLDSGLQYEKDKSGSYTDLMKVSVPHFGESGELEALTAELGIRYTALDENGQPNEKEFPTIQRTFNRSMRKNPDGSKTPELSVEHTILELPTTFKGGGVAADITRASLPEYDKMGADTIKLHANIDQGGYAWASYGYGWDMNVMSQKDLASMISGARTNIETAYEEAGVLDDPRAKNVLDALQQAKENPLAVTPQFLAGIGKDAAILRRGSSGTWYTDEAYTKAITEGRETGEFQMLKGPLHAGKIGLIGSDWHGSIDLKATGPQGGTNRELLEQKLAKKT